jgi:hypothetical protein
MTHSALVQCVRRSMKELGLTPAALHQILGGKVSKQTVYNFVTHGRIIKSDTLLVILGELGIEIVSSGESSKP